MADLREFHGPNAGYVLDLFERYRRDPQSVDEGWRAYFAGFTPPAETTATAAPQTAAAAAPGVSVEKLVAAREFTRVIRVRGHTAANLDPLGGTPDPDPQLDPGFYNLTEADLEAMPAA